MNNTICPCLELDYGVHGAEDVVVVAAAAVAAVVVVDCVVAVGD